VYFWIDSHTLKAVFRGYVMSESVRVSEKKSEAAKEDRTSHARKSNYSQPVNSSVDRILFLQRTIGNQAVGRLIKSGTLQAKLRVGQPDDIYEQEADRVAEQVMRMPEPQIVSGNNFHIQRACPKCEENELKRQPIKEEEEEEKLQRQPIEEEEEKLHAKTASSLNPAVDLDIENHIQSMKGGGHPLSEGERAFFEPRFGADFSQVRAHTDSQAAEAARRVNARAFTTGHDVVFGEGEYVPGTMEGRKLMAHELTHIVRTIGNQAVGKPIKSGALQSEGMSMIRRKVEVNDPVAKPAGAPLGEKNENIIKDYVTTLCSGFTVTAGEVIPTDPAFCPAGALASSNPEACGCLCEMHGLKDPVGASIVWTIVVDDKDWPHTDPSTNTVTVHSPYSGVQFGAWAKGPPAHRMQQQNWLVLGHELCGHARLFARGTHPLGPPPTHGGRPSHDVTVQIENKIASEHGIPASELRGLFADPHHGESVAKVTIAQFPFGSAEISALPPSEQHNLDIAEGFIKSAPVKMDIIGHADKKFKSTASNNIISKRRANKVKAELMGRGISAGRFMASNGVGAAECPLVGDQPPCRKVEVFMFIMEGASVTHK
jgi:outer membrane protein OmpA-like peptidoglycan-associated protein